MQCQLPSPGGIKITKRALEICRFPSGALLADVGCGTGEGVSYINKNTDFRMTGIDNDPSAISVAVAAGNDCICCDATNLPYQSTSLDGIFFQCSFSKIGEPDKAILEAHRVLKPGGKIVISDFYAQKKEEHFFGFIGRVEFKEKIISRLNDQGFELIFLEDHTKELHQLWGQIIFDYGRDVVDSMLCETGRILSAKCGYGLFIAKKTSL
jgi:ubiquinone/menaquinone biosynthesis C-methylase UbiE